MNHSKDRKMKPTFEQYVENAGGLLECPACGGDHLHHVKVDVYERAEDQDSGLHVSVAEGKSSEDANLVGNPSSRRHGLSISFRCEHCSAKPILTIAQHKGNTWVNFLK